MPRFTPRRFAQVIIGALALSVHGVSAVAQPRTPEEAREQARMVAMQQAQQRAQAARDRQQAQQRDNASERSIVLPQDYPNVSGEPMRSGVPMSTYTRMLHDLDPAYRMFAVGQLARFDVTALAGSEVFAQGITRALETRATADPDPGVRVFAMGHLARIDAEAAERAARAMLDELPHGSGAWAFALSALAHAAPGEYLPEVRRSLLEGVDPNESPSHRLWVVYMTHAPFDDSIELVEEIGRLDSAGAPDRPDRIRFASNDHMGAPTLPLATTVFRHLTTAMLPPDGAGISERETHERQDAVASLLGRMFERSLVEALDDEEVRSHLQERFLPDDEGRSRGFDPMGHARTGPGSRRSIPEEWFKLAQMFASFDPTDRFEAALFASIERAFERVVADADERDRALLEAMRSESIASRQRIFHTGFRPDDAGQAFRWSGRITARSLLGAGASADRFTALLESIHEASPPDDHWFIAPDCLSSDAGDAGR